MTSKLIIFDCDGVLVDSEGIANKFLSKAICEAGIDLDPDMTRRTYKGWTMGGVVQDVERRLGRQLPEDWLDILQEKTFNAFKTELQPVEGVREVLEQVVARELSRCVASQGRPEKMALTLGVTGLAEFFGDAVFSAHMVRRPKPEPDLFLYAAAQMGVRPENTLVIEDSLSGVRAGVAAGMDVIAYAADPLSPYDEFEKLGATVVDNMSEILRLL